MKKILSVILSILVCSTLFAGCGKTTSETTLDKIKQAGVMKFAMDATYPPMEFVDSNHNLTGFDVDVAKAVAKKMGVKAQFVNISWDAVFSALASKKFDVIQCALSITDERKKTLVFTDPYVYGGNALYVKKGGNSSIKTESDLSGKTAGCQIGTTAQDVLSKVSGIKEVKKYNSSVEEFMDLDNGRVDLVACDPMVGDYYSLQNKGKYERLKLNLTKEPIGVGFRKADTTLRDAYNKALNELKNDGTLSKLSIKYFGYDVYKK